MNSVNYILFEKITEKPPSSYLLDSVTTEFESIISCVSKDHLINRGKNKHVYQSSLSVPPLRVFIESIVTKSNTNTGTLVSSLSYARRLKKLLSHTSRGMECTRHRIFLATLIITTKYIHDTAFKNKHWMNYAEIFRSHEINLMEKQLLQLLDYNLEISDFDLIVDDTVQLYSKEYLVTSDSFISEYSTSSSWDAPMLVSSIL
ncbi:unnamed protein product [Rhizopus stolonifer]